MIFGPVGYQNFSMGVTDLVSESGRALRCAVSPLATRKIPSSVRLDVCRVTGSEVRVSGIEVEAIGTEVGLASVFCAGDSVMELQPDNKVAMLANIRTCFMLNGCYLLDILIDTDLA